MYFDVCTVHLVVYYPGQHKHTHTYVCVFGVCVCLCVCMYIYIYIYIHTHTIFYISYVKYSYMFQCIRITFTEYYNSILLKLEKIIKIIKLNIFSRLKCL